MSCVFVCEVWPACGGVGLQGKSKCYQKEEEWMVGGGELFVQITGAHYRVRERDRKLSFGLGFLPKSALIATDIQ